MTLPAVTAVYLFSLSVSAAVIALGAGEESTVVIIIGVVLFIGSIVFDLLMHRCPWCRRYIRTSLYSYCPHCGAEISWEDKFYLNDKIRQKAKKDDEPDEPDETDET